MRTEPREAETCGLPDTAIKADLPLLDIWLTVMRDPLLTAVLNQHGAGCLVRLADMTISRQRRPDLVFRDDAGLAI